MKQYVNVPLPERIYRRIKRWAESRQQTIDEAIVDVLSDALLGEAAPVIPPREPDPQVEREKAAYMRLFPQLKERYFGQYVAIYDGQLVDHDENYAALFERVDDRFPDTFVWLAPVEDEPMSTITFRSPRFVEDAG